MAGSDWHLQDPDALSRVRGYFSHSRFIQELGMQLDTLEAGLCETRLAVTPRHFQANDFVHAAVQTALADHSAGMAAGTLVPHDQHVLTAEFKINLLRPARGPVLTCRAEVLKAGRQLSVAESRVHEGDKLVAIALVTLATVRS